MITKTKKYTAYLSSDWIVSYIAKIIESPQIYDACVSRYLDYYRNQGFKYIMFDKYGQIMVSKKLPDVVINGSYVFYFQQVEYIDNTVIPYWSTDWISSIKEL